MKITQQQQQYLDEAYDRQKDAELDAKAEAEEFREAWFYENVDELKRQFKKNSDLKDTRVSEDEVLDICDIYADEFRQFCDEEFNNYIEEMRLKHI